MTKSYKLDQYGYAHVWELHHLHECPEENQTTLPPPSSSTLTSSLGGTIKPLKYNNGDNLDPDMLVESVDGSMKLSTCPHHIPKCGHIGSFNPEGPVMVYRDVDDGGAPDCQHIEGGFQIPPPGPDMGALHCAEHMIAT